MEQHQTSPQPPALGSVEGPAIPVLSKIEGITHQIRHDGWTGEKMAIFCETLAETAVVSEACDAAGMSPSGAYAARRRNPVFAAAWDAALGIARERLADTLLARSMEGNVEQIYKDGELVGERHVLFAVEALRTGDDEGVAKALALAEGDKVDEVEGPPNPSSEGDEDEGLDLSDRCWWSDLDECWLTNFPPPVGFSGVESRRYDDVYADERYQRTCTDEEAAILQAGRDADLAAERAEDEELRDAWFEMLRSDLAATALEEPAGAETASG